MTNRIGSYLWTIDERLDRALTTIGFCEAIARLHTHGGGGFRKEEFDALARLQGEAVLEFRNAGVPLPWEARGRGFH